MRSPKSLRLTPLARAFSVFASCLFVSSSAHAVDWRFTPSVGGAVTYTDNVNQTAEGQNAFILSVTPGFSLISHGSRRVQASVNYALTAAARFGDNNSNDLYHNLSAVGKAELVDDFLFVDGTAAITQGLISLFGSNADASTNNSNRASVGVYTLSPYIKKRFGTFANAEVRYTLGGAIFGSNTTANAVTNSFIASLDSGSQFNDLSWSVDYSLYHADNSGSTRNSTFERGSVTLGYALSRKIRIFGTYGEERNDYLSARNASGSFYNVGAGWSPSRRTNFEATLGERYFGRTYSFSGRHQTRASNWHINYSEDISDVSQQFLRSSGRIFWVCNNRLYETKDFTPPPSQTACSGPFTSSQVTQALNTLGVPLSDLIAAGFVDVAIANGVYVINSLTGGVSWSKGRLGLGLSFFDTKRIYQDIAGVEDRSQGVTGTVSYRLNPRTSANTSLSVIRNKITNPFSSARDDQIFSLTLGLNHQFGRDLTGALSFRHQQRESNFANFDYTENSLTASANLRF
ncbi:MAG: TIGR03016 family PEP-CTERM system-associated outer membrane protein [Thiobacillus sp.]